MLKPRKQESPFSMDDFVARRVAQILRDSREHALREAGIGTLGHAPAAGFVGEKTCAVIKGITAQNSMV